MYNVHYSVLEIATTWWRQDGVVIRVDRLSISVMRTDGVRFLPRSRATLTQTRWLWWKFIVLRGKRRKTDSVKETKDCCI